MFHTILFHDSPRKISCNIIKLNFNLVLISAPTTFDTKFSAYWYLGVGKTKKRWLFFSWRPFFFLNYLYSMTCKGGGGNNFDFNQLKKSFRISSYRVSALNCIAVTKPWTNSLGILWHHDFECLSHLFNNILLQINNSFI